MWLLSLRGFLVVCDIISQYDDDSHMSIYLIIVYKMELYKLNTNTVLTFIKISLLLVLLKGSNNIRYIHFTPTKKMFFF